MLVNECEEQNNTAPVSYKDIQKKTGRYLQVSLHVLQKQFWTFGLLVGCTNTRTFTAAASRKRFPLSGNIPAGRLLSLRDGVEIPSAHILLVGVIIKDQKTSCNEGRSLCRLVSKSCTRTHHEDYS